MLSLKLPDRWFPMNDGETMDHGSPSAIQPHDKLSLHGSLWFATLVRKLISELSLVGDWGVNALQVYPSEHLYDSRADK